MFLSTIKLPCVTWIASLAVAISSISPAVSQTVFLAEHGKGFTAEICTASGQKMVQKVDLSDDVDQALQLETCAYCIVHIALDFPIHSVYSFSLPVSGKLFPQLFYESPKPLFAWVKLPSQAPPQ